MTFKKFNEDQISTLDQIAALQKILTRSELTDMLATIRLQVVQQALTDLEQDPRFLEQDEGVRLAILSAIAETRAKELSHRADVLPWLQDVPSRIARLWQTLDSQNDKMGGTHV